MSGALKKGHRTFAVDLRERVCDAVLRGELLRNRLKVLSGVAYDSATNMCSPLVSPGLLQLGNWFEQIQTQLYWHFIKRYIGVGARYVFLRGDGPNSLPHQSTFFYLALVASLHCLRYLSLAFSKYMKSSKSLSDISFGYVAYIFRGFSDKVLSHSSTIIPVQVLLYWKLGKGFKPHM